MTTTIIGAITAALGSVGVYFAWKSRSTALRREAAAEVAKEEELRDARKAEIREIVYSNDDERLNQLVNQLMED